MPELTGGGPPAAVYPAPVYDDIAPFYDSIYGSLKDYAGEARRIRQLVDEYRPGARTLLDVGCGTGTHVGHLRERFDVVGLDLSGGLLRVARGKFPDIPFHQASMDSFELTERFDLVTCLFGAVGYMRDRTRLAKALANMASHLHPGGLLLLEPWLGPDKFRAGSITQNVVDDADLKVAWMYVARREGNVSVFDIHYLVGTHNGVSHFRDEQVLGLFRDEEYLEALAAAGLSLLAHHENGLHGYGLYLCRNTWTRR